jgi:hypothetical protein
VVLESSRQQSPDDNTAAAADAGFNFRLPQQQQVQQQTYRAMAAADAGSGAAAAASADAGKHYRASKAKQQQQMDSDTPPSSITVESLLLLVDAHRSLKEYQQQAFARILKLLCSLTRQSAATADAAALLAAAPDVLLPHLLQAAANNQLTFKSAFNTISYLQHLLQLQPVQTLFSEAAMEALQDQVAEAKEEVTRSRRAQERQEKKPQQQRQQQQQPQRDVRARERQQQQQQQQQRYTLPSSPTTADLRPLLAKSCSEVGRIMHMFDVWQQLCGTDDVTGLLGRFDELQQHLSSSGLSANTLASHYYRKLRQVLRLVEVQQLLQPQQLQVLQEKVNAAHSAALAAAEAPPASQVAHTDSSKLVAAATAAYSDSPVDIVNNMSLEQLQQLLQRTLGSGADKATYAFNAWSTLCGSTDVAVLLSKFDQLLERLTGSEAAYSIATAQQHLRYIYRAIEGMPQLQQLAGGPRQAQQLLRQIKAAIVEVKVGCSL